MMILHAMMSVLPIRMFQMMKNAFLSVNQINFIIVLVTDAILYNQNYVYITLKLIRQLRSAFLRQNAHT